MESITFSAGNRFRLNEQEYMIRKFINDDDVELTNLSYDNEIEIFSLTELLTAWFENRLKMNRENVGESSKIPVYDTEVLTEDERDIMEKRFKVLKPVISGEVYSKDYKTYIDSLSDDLKRIIGSVAALYRWKKRWDETEDKRSLIPGDRFRKSGYRTDPVIVRMIEKMVMDEDKTGLRQTTREKWIELKELVKEYNLTREDNEKLKACGLTTVFRIEQDLKNSYERDKKRHGVVQASLNQHGSTTELDVERPLERVEIDWTPIDLKIVDFLTDKTVRYNLVYAIDVCTDYPLGFYICKNVDTNALKQCLLHAMLPKVHLKKLYPKLNHDWLAYGKPEVIVLDNAKVNEADDFEEVCNLLGIEVQFCPVKSGHQKGTIERGLQTVNKKLQQLPGSTFSNPQERSQYDSDEEACIDILTLYHIIHVVLIELVANNFSLGVEGIPENIWKEELKKLKVHRKLPYSKEELILLLATGVDYRVITNKGIEIKSQHYISDELMKLRDRKNRKKDEEKVRVRYNPADMRVVYVYDEENHQYIEALPTRNSLKRKGIDDRYPVHYDQIYAYSYNLGAAYRNFKTDDIAEANRGIKELVNKSKQRLKDLEQLPEDEKAKIMAADLAVIQATYDSQFAPDDLQSLQLIEDVIQKQSTGKSDKAGPSQKKKEVQDSGKSSAEKTSRNRKEANLSNHGNEFEELEGFETTIRKKL